MTITFDYCSTQFLSIDEIHVALHHAREHYPVVREPPTEQQVFATLEPARLPAFMDLTVHARLEAFWIKGRLSHAGSPFPSFEHILNESSGDLAPVASVVAKVGYEDKASKQTKRNYDSIGIALHEGKILFVYSPHGSRVGNDHVYRRSFLPELIEIAALPLVMDDSGDYYRLTHQSGGYLWVSGCFPPDLSPTVFHCELSGDTVTMALARMQRALDAIASSKRFENSWSVSLSTEDQRRASDETLAGRTYRVLEAKCFPAESYFLSLDLKIREIEAVESLKSFCGAKDEILVPLCGFLLSHEDDHYFNLELGTTARGHRLLVEASVPVNVNKLGSRLGVELVERGHG